MLRAICRHVARPGRDPVSHGPSGVCRHEGGGQLPDLGQLTHSRVKGRPGSAAIQPNMHVNAGLCERRRTQTASRTARPRLDSRMPSRPAPARCTVSRPARLSTGAQAGSCEGRRRGVAAGKRRGRALDHRQPMRTRCGGAHVPRCSACASFEAHGRCAPNRGPLQASPWHWRSWSSASWAGPWAAWWARSSPA